MQALTFTSVRHSPLAGTWYPGRAETLRQTIERFIDAAEPTAPTTHLPRALLAPHAGYRFSGPVAAHSFLQVQNQPFETVVVIGPLHYQLPDLPPTAGVLTTGHSAYQTPLGDVPIDTDSLIALAKEVPLTQVRDDPEHSIEVEIPFLQFLLKPGFRLLPIMLNDQRVDTARLLGEALARILKEKQALLIASSDLSHFYQQKVANAYDQKMLDRVVALDAENVIRYDERGIAFACGCGAIAAVIYALQMLEKQAGVRASVLNYATSGDINGDYSRVVGYGAAAF